MATRKPKETQEQKWTRLLVRHERWQKLTGDQLKGADFGLRVLHTSTAVRGEALAVLEMLMGQVRAEMRHRNGLEGEPVVMESEAAA